MNKLAVIAALLLMMVMPLTACTSIITYIKSDNRHDNISCDSDDGSQGILDVNGECKILKPGKQNKDEAT
ncbi:hypothetical protein J7Y46_003027 [Vibrio parahaemolyticus]|nr:hypothetical protein [Vibrio parahaemolyticus]EHV5554772.1 hypothetical protein [Vibrio parahaemolyticus]